jgi:TrmH family RNA methyltransferase
VKIIDMLTQAQEKLIRSLHTRKGREQEGLCLVEGEKLVREYARHLLFSFTPEDTKNFAKLVTTETPQMIAGVAKLPRWHAGDLQKAKTILVLDHIQDPGNLGAIFRLALGFNASLVLVECTDPGNPKVVRGSAGAIFHVSWVDLPRDHLSEFLQAQNAVYRLEKTKQAKMPEQITTENRLCILVGSEGQGIQSDFQAPSIAIPHSSKLESLNVSTAVAILLYLRQF